MRDGAGVTIDSQYELGQVVGTDRVTVKDSQKLVGSLHVGRELTHRVDLQSIIALLQSLLSHYLNYSLSFLDGAAEGNHDLNVGQPHIFAHTQQRRAFKSESVSIARIVVARSASESKHWIFFLRLKLTAAKESRILIRFEIAGANNYRLGIESSRDPPEIGRAHVLTPVTVKSRMPSSA